MRVLDDKHEAVGQWNPRLEAEDLQVGLRHMLLTRIFDDRMQRTQRQGKISFYMRCFGEEAVAVAQAMALQPGDMLFPSYRQQGIYMVRGKPLVELMCQLLSNTRDMCKGRQLPGHVSLERGPHLLDLRQPNYPVPAGRGLGHGRGHPQRRPHRLHLDRRRLERRGRLPPRHASSRPCTRRRSS